MTRETVDRLAELQATAPREVQWPETSLTRDPDTLPDGLYWQDAPKLPRGRILRCAYCRCSVNRDHVPNSDDCHDGRREREWSQRD